MNGYFQVNMDLNNLKAIDKAFLISSNILDLSIINNSGNNLKQENH